MAHPQCVRGRSPATGRARGADRRCKGKGKGKGRRTGLEGVGIGTRDRVAQHVLACEPSTRNDGERQCVLELQNWDLEDEEIKAKQSKGEQ